VSLIGSMLLVTLSMTVLTGVQLLQASLQLCLVSYLMVFMIHRLGNGDNLTTKHLQKNILHNSLKKLIFGLLPLIRC